MKVMTVQRLEGGGYQAEIDGTSMSVPDDPRNRHTQEVRLWLAKPENVLGPEIPLKPPPREEP